MSLHDSLIRHGLRYRDLFEAPGLQSLDQRFLEYLGVRDAPLHQRLLDYRDSGGGIPALETSRLLLDAAPHLEGFVAEVFGIEEALRVSREATLSHDPVLAFKKEFVLRRARRYRSTGDADFAALNAWLWEQLAGATDGGSDHWPSR
jgi:hypothetical protein